jgi:site-specific recombinase XerD
MNARAHLEHELERKPTTLGDYRSMLKRHVGPFFGEKPLERVDADLIRRYLATKKGEGLATKTITNQLVFLHGLFAFALKRGWIAVNPVAAVTGRALQR